VIPCELMRLGCFSLLAAALLGCSTFDDAETDPGAGGRGGAAFQGWAGGKAGSGGQGGSGAGGSGGVAGKGGAGGAATGMSCAQAIDLTSKGQATLVFSGTGSGKGTCGGGAKAGSCGDPPERWFRYSVSGAAYLVINVRPRLPAFYNEECTNSDYGAVIYAREGCGSGAEELACASPLGLVGSASAYVPVRVKLTKATEVFFAVDGRLSDANELEVVATTEPICTADSDCKILGRPVCDGSSGICCECLTSADCKSAAKPQCNDQGVCVPCLSNEDCKDPAAPACNTLFNECVECNSNTDCKDKEKPLCAFQACTKPTTPACDLPAEPPPPGSCVTLDNINQCNPITNEGCSPGLACDLGGAGFQCFGGSNILDLCQTCDANPGVYCKPTMTCLASSGKCTRYCCEDGDCGAGTCDKTTLFGVPQVGVCLLPP
jgi:hypothetical protein